MYSATHASTIILQHTLLQHNCNTLLQHPAGIRCNTHYCNTQQLQYTPTAHYCRLNTLLEGVSRKLLPKPSRRSVLISMHKKAPSCGGVQPGEQQGSTHSDHSTHKSSNKKFACGKDSIDTISKFLIEVRITSNSTVFYINVSSPVDQCAPTLPLQENVYKQVTKGATDMFWATQ